MFSCQHKQCKYGSLNNNIIKHVWNKHYSASNVKHICRISSCPSVFTNEQSFRQHVKKVHTPFLDKNIKIYTYEIKAQNAPANSDHVASDGQGVIGEGMQISANESEVIEVLWRRLKMKKMLSFPAVTTTKM